MNQVVDRSLLEGTFGGKNTICMATGRATATKAPGRGGSTSSPTIATPAKFAMWIGVPANPGGVEEVSVTLSGCSAKAKYMEPWKNEYTGGTTAQVCRAGQEICTAGQEHCPPPAEDRGDGDLVIHRGRPFGGRVCRISSITKTWFLAARPSLNLRREGAANSIERCLDETRSRMSMHFCEIIHTKNPAIKLPKCGHAFIFSQRRDWKQAPTHPHCPCENYKTPFRNIVKQYNDGARSTSTSCI